MFPHLTDGMASISGVEPLNAKIGAEIRRIRKRLGMTQAEASERILGSGELQSQWSRWERGKVRPNVATLARIADAAGVSMSVFGLEEPREGWLSPTDAAELRMHLERALAVLGRAVQSAERGSN